MKENLISDKSLIYQWTFTDNMSVVDNYRVKATVFGNPTYNNGIVTFNGSTDYYKLKTLINLGTKYSIEVKAKSAFTANGDYIVGGYSVGGLSLIDIFKTSNTIVHCGKSFGTNTFPTDQQWHIYTITRNGNVAISLYIDGVFIISVNMSSNINMLVKAIGALDDGNYKWNGQLEYIKIWNRQLSPSEVKNNYSGKTYKALPYVSGEILGSELITNQADREFSSDTGWWAKTNASITIADGVCHFINVPDGQFCRRLNILTIGVLYRVRFKVINYVIGTIRDSFGGSLKSANGVYDYYINATSTTIGLNNAFPNTTLDIEYFYVEEVLQSSKNTLFHINSDNGVIRDLTGKTIPVATNVQLPKIGSNINVMKFDGLSGNINIGSQALVGDITFMGWSNSINLGEGNNGQILSNGSCIIRLNADRYLLITRNIVINYATTSINAIKLGNNQFICITSTSTGITNFYIGDKNNPPTLSGTDNQNAGNPVPPTQPITCYLGNRSWDDRTLNGWLNDIRMEQSILTLEEITQYWSNTKYKY